MKRRHRSGHGTGYGGWRSYRKRMVRKMGKSSFLRFTLFPAGCSWGEFIGYFLLDDNTWRYRTYLFCCTHRQYRRNMVKGSCNGCECSVNGDIFHFGFGQGRKSNCIGFKLSRLHKLLAEIKWPSTELMENWRRQFELTDGLLRIERLFCSSQIWEQNF